MVSSRSKKSIIHVPQKCYAVITPETPIDIAGICTTGLNCCAGVAIFATDTSNNYLFLCHADALTNLADINSGLIPWLKMIPEECSNIVVYCDEVDEIEYINQVQMIVNEFLKLETNKSIKVSPTRNSTSGLAIMRHDGKLQYGHDINFALEDEGYDIQNSPLNYRIGEVIRSLEKDFKTSPICIYDSTHILTLDEIKTACSFIKIHTSEDSEDSTPSSNDSDIEYRSTRPR